MYTYTIEKQDGTTLTLTTSRELYIRLMIATHTFNTEQELATLFPEQADSEWRELAQNLKASQVIIEAVFKPTDAEREVITQYLDELSLPEEIIYDEADLVSDADNAGISQIILPQQNNKNFLDDVYKTLTRYLDLVRLWEPARGYNQQFYRVLFGYRPFVEMQPPTEAFQEGVIYYQRLTHGQVKYCLYEDNREYSKVVGITGDDIVTTILQDIFTENPRLKGWLADSILTMIKNLNQMLSCHITLQDEWSAYADSNYFKNFFPHLLKKLAMLQELFEVISALDQKMAFHLGILKVFVDNIRTFLANQYDITLDINNELASVEYCNRSFQADVFSMFTANYFTIFANRTRANYFGVAQVLPDSHSIQPLCDDEGEAYALVHKSMEVGIS